MIMLGEEASAEILKQLDDDEVQLIGREVARIQSIAAEQSETVLEEFYQMAIARDYVVKGGLDYARKILINAFGPEQAKKMLDRLMKSLGNDEANFDAIQKADPQQLAKFIHSEHPQTIALILSHLNSSPGRGVAVLTAIRVARRCRPAHGQPRPDFAGDHHQDRSRDWIEAEVAW